MLTVKSDIRLAISQMSNIRHPKKRASNVKYATFDVDQYRIKIESNLFAYL